MTPRRIRPIGQPTRGKTALNRLRQVDNYVALALPGILSGILRGDASHRTASPLVIDVGFGAYPWTMLEMRQRWLSLNPRLRVLGVEIDAERVEAALPSADPPAIDFKLGGFNLVDVLGSERARLIRCYNVLRQYDESAVVQALDAMARALEPGGILIEGTSNPSGRLVAFDLYVKREESLTHHGLVFGTNFRAPLDPANFQAILPKRLIHHMLDPVPSAFFVAWQDAYRRTRDRSGRQQWIAAARLLAELWRYPVDIRPRLLRRGFLTLYATLSDPIHSD